MSTPLNEIAAAVQAVYREAVHPIAERFAYRPGPTAGEVGGPALVLLLGNHSSGKSSFINHLLDAPVQKTGLAPTDDGFTIISHGEKELERDGAAVVGNPQLPFGDLRGFGDGLVSHLKLKRRPTPLLEQTSLVDSPGMIDAAGADGGRGYDFVGAVRWFAERADVVLFFFDPDKPGTTGETLQVFERALQGLDHKLLIVMNKMDRFRTLPDFARAYGALCWNLAKVIPRKDLPFIYTTYTPVEGAPEPVLPVDDFTHARAELIAEIARAPARRVDNMLTRLAAFSARLQVHARVLDAAARTLRRFRAKAWAIVFASVIGLGLAGGLSLYFGAPTGLAVGLFAGAGLAGYLGWLIARRLIAREGEHLGKSLGDFFEQAYARPLLVRERAEDLRALWTDQQARIAQTARAIGLLKVPKLANSEAARLDRVITDEVPALRARLHVLDEAREPVAIDKV